MVEEGVDRIGDASAELLPTTCVRAALTPSRGCGFAVRGQRNFLTLR